MLTSGILPSWRSCVSSVLLAAGLTELYAALSSRSKDVPGLHDQICWVSLLGFCRVLTAILSSAIHPFSLPPLLTIQLREKLVAKMGQSAMHTCVWVFSHKALN